MSKKSSKKPNKGNAGQTSSQNTTSLSTTGNNTTVTVTSTLSDMPSDESIRRHRMRKWGLLLLPLLAIVFLLPRACNSPAIANPVITSPAANAELAAGVVHFAGTGQADNMIRISGNNQPLGETKVDSAGNWQADIDLPAAEKLEIVAQALDANGAVAAASTAFAVKVNGAAVAAAAEPTATAEAVATATTEVSRTIPSEAPTTITATLPTINFVSEALPAGTITLDGSGTPGATMDLRIDDQSVGTAVVDAAGKWSLAFDYGEVGAHEAKVVELDAAGAALATSDPLVLTIAAGAESEVLLPTATPDVAALAQSAAITAAIEVITPTVVAEAISTTVALEVITPTVAPEASSAITATEAAASETVTGTASSESAAITTTAGIAAGPAASETVTGTASSSTEAVASETVTGTASSESAAITTTAGIAASTAASETVTGTASSETAAITTTAGVAASAAASETVTGTASSEITTSELTATKGPSFALSALAMNAGAIPIFGTGKPNSTVEVSVNGSAVVTAAVAADGKWQSSFTLSDPGEYAVSVSEIDSSGAALASSPALPLLIFAIQPATATDTPTPQPTDTATPVPTNTPAATDTATALPTATAQPTDTATAVPTDTTVPTDTATAVPTDTATPLPTSTSTVTPLPTDTPAPTDTPEPTATNTEAAAEGPFIYLPGVAWSSGGVPVYGSALPNTNVEVVVDGTVVTTATTDSSGRWEATFDLPASGDYILAVNQLDAQGNVVKSSSSVSLLVFATATATPTFTPTDTPTQTPTATDTPTPTNTPTATPTDTNTPTHTFTPTPTNTATATNAATPTFTATATDTATATATHTATFTPTRTPTETPKPTNTATATHTPTNTATATKTATNTPLPITPPSIDTSGLQKEIVTGALTLRGEGEPNSTVSVFVNNEKAGDAEVDSSGKWSLATSLSAAGEYTVTVETVDNAGKIVSSEAVSLIAAQPTATATKTATAKPTDTATPEPTNTPTDTATALPTNTPTATDTATPKPTNTATDTATALPTNTPTATDTATPKPTNTPTDTATPLPTNTPTATDTATPKPTNTPTDTATPLPTNTPTASDTATPKPTNTPTDTATPLPTNTPTATDTATPKPTNTPTDTATPLPTNTPTATDTATPKPTNTPTDTATDTATPKPTNTPTDTATPLPTSTPTATNTPKPTNTATRTPTATKVPTATSTPTATGPGTLLVTSANKLRASNVEIILDASGSMAKPLGDSYRINVADAALTDLVANQLNPDTELAVRIFGHKEERSCKTYLEVPVAPINESKAATTFKGVQPAAFSKTAIAASLAFVTEDMAAVNGTKVVLLLTDGEETCGGNPAAEIEKLVANGDVRVNIIGFAVDDAAAKVKFNEWAKLGNGSYIDATSGEELSAALDTALRAPYRLLNAKGDIVETGTVNGVPIELNPGTYTLFVEAVEGERKEQITIVAGKETTVNVK